MHGVGVEFPQIQKSLGKIPGKGICVIQLWYVHDMIQDGSGQLSARCKAYMGATTYTISHVHIHLSISCINQTMNRFRKSGCKKAYI